MTPLSYHIPCPVEYESRKVKYEIGKLEQLDFKVKVQGPVL